MSLAPNIALIGDPGVGKTSIMARYCRGLFQHGMSSIGIDHATKRLEIDNLPIELHVWDTAGQERFRTITQSYYRNAHGVIVVYDITDYDTLTGLSKWFDDAYRYAPKNVLICLVGAKKDMESKREVSEEQAKKLASTYPNVVAVIETSAKNAINIDVVFETLIRAIKAHHERRHTSSPAIHTEVLYSVEPGKECLSKIPCCNGF